MPPAVDDPEFEEEICPECGQPKLRAWGTTCGTCRLATGHLREAELVAQQRPGIPPLTFAWLVVVSSSDQTKSGRVIPLSHAMHVITRDGSVTGNPGEVVLRDNFLSAGHAVIRLVIGAELSFTLEDRREPGPSSHGTFLGGRRLEPGEAAPLCDYDEIRVGTTELVFRSLSIPGGPL
jgi:hypothetical protein